MTIEELKHIYMTMADGGVELCSVREILKQLDSVELSSLPEHQSILNKECATCFHCTGQHTHDGTCIFCKDKSHYKYKLEFQHNNKKDVK